MANMPSSTSQGAVSEYESLNAKNYKIYDHINSEEEEEDIPMKSQNKTFKNSSKFINLQTVDCDNEGIFSTRLLPLPYSFSPDLSGNINPSIFLTPEKPSSQESHIKFYKENILEPHDSNKIPVPTSWSPGMVVKSNPSVFITPEKSVMTHQSVIKDNFALHSTEMKENFVCEAVSLKSKGKHSVRFDLPSLDDEYLSVNSVSAESIKSQDTHEESCVVSSSIPPTHLKKVRPPKSYDPHIYSDTSALKNYSFSHNQQTSDPQQIDPLSFPIQTPLSEAQALPILSDGSDFSIFIAAEKYPPDESSSKKKIERKTLKHTNSETSFPSNKSISKSKFESSRLSGKDCSKTRSSNLLSGPQNLKSSISQYDNNCPTAIVVRESKNKFVEPEYSYPFDCSYENGDPEFEHAFARPEFNSTLRVRSELDDLCQSEIDIQTAVKERLGKDETKRTEMNEKASILTNRVSDQFHNLVDLDTSLESLCERIVRMRTSKAVAKKKAMPLKKQQGQKPQPPDLMEFFSPELQKETTDLSLPGITQVTTKLLTAPDNVAFELYRHNRLWNGINDI